MELENYGPIEQVNAGIYRNKSKAESKTIFLIVGGLVFLVLAGIYWAGIQERRHRDLHHRNS